MPVKFHVVDLQNPDPNPNSLGSMWGTYKSLKYDPLEHTEEDEHGKTRWKD